MDHDRSPVNVKGDRNFFCAYYNECLDYAVKLNWKHWACLDCQHEHKMDFVTDVLLSPEHTDMCHSLSSSLMKSQKIIHYTHQGIP